MTRFPKRDIEKVTRAQVDYLRSMLHEQMPHAKVVSVERKYRERTLPNAQVGGNLGAFIDVLTVVWFEHDGRPLPPNMKKLRDFNVIERVAKEAHGRNKA